MFHTIEIYFLLFMTYAFLGWGMEVCCKFIQYKRFINRGFLIGPYCPIYGWGALLITLLLQKYSNDPVALFILGMVICSFLEYFTSYIMEKIFHARWWDYSTKKFNINGRICLDTMIPFGILGVLIVYFINPKLYHFFNGFDGNTLNIICIVILSIFLLDIFLSTIILISVRRENKVLDKDNTEQMTKRVREKIKTLGWPHNRLLMAFPNVRHIGIVLKKQKGKLINNVFRQKNKYNERQRRIIEKSEEKRQIFKLEYEFKIKRLENKTNKKIDNINKKEKDK